ncbi:DegV family protein [Peptostreptococcus stomatis]
MDIKLICDSLCDIPDDLYNKEYLEIVPLTLILDGKEYRDNIDLTKEEFYERALKSSQVPKTSQATYMQFKEVFDKAIEEGKKVICITGSSTKSGTYQSALLAKNDTDGPIHVFDTEQLSLGAGQYVVRACDMIDEGLSYDEVLSGLEIVRDTVSILFAPSSFDFLKKSGRVNLTTAILGNMLNIKPIFIMEKGEIALASKVRGVKKLVGKLIDMVLEKNEKYLGEITVIVGYGSNLESFAKLKEEVEKRLEDKVKKIVYAKGGACICSHTGPDIIAISYSK